MSWERFGNAGLPYSVRLRRGGNMGLMGETGDAPPMYLSFLLRLWRESEHGAWRASLESVTTGERHGFPNLPRLLAFLEDECQALTDYHQEAGKHQSPSKE